MAVISVTAADVGRPHPSTDEVYTMIASSAITAGQVVYIVAATAKVAPADGDVGAADQGRGIALAAAAAEEPVPVLIRGFVSGFDVSALNGDVFVYLSDTVGRLDTATGTLEVRMGRVVGGSEVDSDGNVNRMIYIDSRLTTDWA